MTEPLQHMAVSNLLLLVVVGTQVSFVSSRFDSLLLSVTG